MNYRSKAVKDYDALECQVANNGESQMLRKHSSQKATAGAIF